MADSETPQRASMFRSEGENLDAKGFKMTPKSPLGREERDKLDQVALETGFKSGSSVSGNPSNNRRKTVVRDKQLNIKVTGAEADRFYALVNEQGVPLGVIFAQALSALEDKLGK